MKLKGYVWKKALDIRPKLVSSHTYTLAKRAIPSSAICHAPWVLDYSFTAGAAVKAGKVTNPWNTRLANQAHLYAPRTNYWEQTYAPVRAGYIKFESGEKAGLDRLVESGNTQG